MVTGGSVCFLVLALNACVAASPAVDPVPEHVDEFAPVPDRAEATLPRVHVEQVAGGPPMEKGPLGVPVPDEVAEPAPLRGEVQEIATAGQRITLTAVGTDLRSLLTGLAEAAGVNLVVAPGVEGRVTVHFDNVPAREALEQVVRETGHVIARPLSAPFGRTAHHMVPVNVNHANVALIRARFGVSEELARFLVQARVPPE